MRIYLQYIEVYSSIVIEKCSSNFLLAVASGSHLVRPTLPKIPPDAVLD